MSSIPRRSFLAQTAALLPIARVAFAAPERPSLGNLGVELYTVRNVIENDPAGVLHAIQDIGYMEVEVVYASLDKIWSALKHTGLKAVSAHVDGAVLRDQTKVDGVLAGLKEKGFEYVVYPYVPEPERGDADTYKRMAEAFGHIGERAKANGLTFCYHNHAFEFKPLGNGKTAFDYLIRDTDKSLVFLEMDIFWVSVAGHDPVAMLQELSGRVPLLHLKDKQKGLAVQYNEKVSKETFREVGSGSIDIPAVLNAASSAGVKHFFVEQDQTAGDPIESLKKSYQYLSPLMQNS